MAELNAYFDGTLVKSPYSIAGFAAVLLDTDTTNPAVQTAVLPVGKYAAVVTNDAGSAVGTLPVFVKIHASDASDVTIATGFPVIPGETVVFEVPPGGAKIGAIAQAAGQTLRIHRV